MGVPNAPALNLASVLNVTGSAFAPIFAKAIIITAAAVVISGFKSPFICKSSYGFPLINFSSLTGALPGVCGQHTEHRLRVPTILMTDKGWRLERGEQCGASAGSGRFQPKNLRRYPE